MTGPVTTSLYQIQQEAEGWRAVSAWHPEGWTCAFQGPGTFRACIRDATGQETATAPFTLGKGTARLLVDCQRGVVWKGWHGLTWVRAVPVFDEK